MQEVAQVDGVHWVQSSVAQHRMGGLLGDRAAAETRLLAIPTATARAILAMLSCILKAASGQVWCWYSFLWLFSYGIDLLSATDRLMVVHCNGRNGQEQTGGFPQTLSYAGLCCDSSSTATHDRDEGQSN